MQGGTTLACTCTHLAPTAPLTSLHPSPHCTPALFQRGRGPQSPPRHRGLGCEAAAGRQWWRGGEGGQVCAHYVVPVVHRSPPPADTDTGAAELVLPLLCSAVT